MEYQHHVTIWNFDTGMRTIGVFKTRKEAEDFQETTEGREKTYTSQISNWPYGVLSQPFDVEAALKRAEQHAAQSVSHYLEYGCD